MPSNYETGFDDAAGQLHVGGELFSPSMVSAEMRTVDAVIFTVKTALQSEDPKTETAKQFARFADEWKQFRTANDSWFKLALNTTYDKVQEFKRRAIDWQQALTRKGLSMEAPAVREKTGVSITKWHVLGAGALAFLLYKGLSR